MHGIDVAAGTRRRHIRDTKNGRASLVAATPSIEAADKPVLVAWGADDTVGPPHATDSMRAPLELRRDAGGTATWLLR